MSRRAVLAPTILLADGRPDQHPLTIPYVFVAGPSHHGGPFVEA